MVVVRLDPLWRIRLVLAQVLFDATIAMKFLAGLF